MSNTYSAAPISTIDLSALAASRFILPDERLLPYRDATGAINVHLLRQSLQHAESCAAVVKLGPPQPAEAGPSPMYKAADAEAIEKLRRWLRHAERWEAGMEVAAARAAGHASEPASGGDSAAHGGAGSRAWPDTVAPAAALAAAPASGAETKEAVVVATATATERPELPVVAPVEEKEEVVVIDAFAVAAGAEPQTAAVPSKPAPPRCPKCGGVGATKGGWGHVSENAPLPEYRYRCREQSCAHVWHTAKHTLPAGSLAHVHAAAVASGGGAQLVPYAPARNRHARHRAPLMQQLHEWVLGRLAHSREEHGAEWGPKRSEQEAWAAECVSTPPFVRAAMQPDAPATH